MGNWWLAPSSQQGACSCITSQMKFFGKTSNHPGQSAPLQPRFGAPQGLLAPPKTKITFAREEISDHQWESGKYHRAADGNWENCVPTLKGTEVLLSYIQCFLYLVSSSVNVSIFHITWLDAFWICPLYIGFCIIHGLRHPLVTLEYILFGQRGTAIKQEEVETHTLHLKGVLFCLRASFRFCKWIS